MVEVELDEGQPGERGDGEVAAERVLDDVEVRELGREADRLGDLAREAVVEDVDAPQPAGAGDLEAVEEVGARADLAEVRRALDERPRQDVARELANVLTDTIG